MKKTLLALALASISLGAFAQTFPTSPAQGVIDLVYNEGGASNIDIMEFVKLNRACPGLITLERDGEVIKQLPAQSRWVSTYEGFTKNVEPGNLNISFFQKTPNPATQPGNYKVTIPAGLFYWNDSDAGQDANWVLNEEAVYNYKIEGTAAMTIDPAAAATVGGMSKIVMTFPAGTEITYTRPEPVLHTSTDEESGATIESWEYGIGLYPTGGEGVEASSVDIQGNVVTVNFDPAVTIPGTAFFTIASGCMKVNGTDYTYECSYTISSASGNGTVYPEIGGSWEKLVSFPSGVMSGTNEYYAFFRLTLEEPATYILMGKPQFCPMVDGVADPTNDYVFAINKNPDDNKELIFRSSTYSAWYAESELTPLPGTYCLYIPEKSFQTAGGYNTAMTFGPYYISAGTAEKDYTMIPAPGSTVPEVAEITLSFPAGTELAWKPAEYATLSNGAIDYDVRATIESTEDFVVARFTFLAPVKINGDWTFTVPAGALTVDGKDLPVSETLTIDTASGIAGIDASPAPRAIYNLHGQRLNLNPASLPSGLYIIDGRKVLVK